MEKIKSPELIEILSSNRSRINTLVHMSSQNFSRVNPKIINTMILAILEPLFLKTIGTINQFSNTKNFSLDQWTLKIFELILDSIGYGLLDNKRQLSQIKDIFLKLFTSYLPLAFPNPEPLWKSLLHSLHNFERMIKNQFIQFSESMNIAAKYITSLEELQKFGFVLAWSLGMAAYRNTALSYLHDFSPEWLSIIFGGPSTSWKQVKPIIIDELHRSPWFLPFSAKSAQKFLFYRIGGFLGDHGFFISPPSVYYSQLGFIAHDTSHVYRIFCDAFGVQLVPINEKPEKAKSGIQPLFTTEDHSELFSAQNFFQSRQSFLLEPKTWICNKEAFFFTIPNSHYLFIIAKTRNFESAI